MKARSFKKILLAALATITSPFITAATTETVESTKQSAYQTPVIHIGVVVSDLSRSMDFYQNIMGMVKVTQYELNADVSRRTGLANGMPFTIEVLKIEDSPSATEWKLMSFNKEAKHPEQEFIYDDTGMQYMTVLVNDLQPFIERFTKNNITLLGQTPTNISDELSFVLVQDPDGNFIELIGPTLVK